MNDKSLVATSELEANPALGAIVRKAVARRSFATIATASAEGRPHVANLIYQLAENKLWASTLADSRKARNIAANSHVAVTIPVRRLPVGPPAAVFMQAKAELVSPDDDALRRLLEAGALAKITAHGELDLPNGCFVSITPPRRIPTYGLGMQLIDLLRDPLGAGRIAEVDWTGPNTWN